MWIHKLISYKYVYLIPLLLSAIFSLRSFRLKWPRPFRIFSILLLLTVAVEAFAIAWKWGLCKTAYWSYSPGNVWIYNSFLIARYIFTAYFFYEIIKPGFTKSLIKWSIPPFLILAICVLVMSPLLEPNMITLIVENIFFVLFSLFFFRQMLSQQEIIKLSSDAGVWISLGILIYYSGTLPFFISLEYLIKEPGNIGTAFNTYINVALNSVMYIFFLIAFLCKPHPRK